MLLFSVKNIPMKKNYKITLLIRGKSILVNAKSLIFYLGKLHIKNDKNTVIEPLINIDY